MEEQKHNQSTDHSTVEYEDRSYNVIMCVVVVVSVGGRIKVGLGLLSHFV